MIFTSYFSGSAFQPYMPLISRIVYIYIYIYICKTDRLLQNKDLVRV